MIHLTMNLNTAPSFADTKESIYKFVPKIGSKERLGQDLTYDKPNDIISGMIPTKEGQKINLSQRLIYNALLMVVKAQGDKPRYEIDLIDLIRMAGITQENHAYVRAQLEVLSDFKYERNIFVDVLGGIKHDECTIRYIDKPGSIREPGKNTIIYFSLDDELKERVFNPVNGFTPLPLNVLSSFKSGPAVVLAEICYRYRTNMAGKSYGTTGLKPTEWWVPRLLGHLPSIKYEFKFFKRDVLTKAIKNINENKLLPFTIECILDPQGKSIRAIGFHIFPKPNELEGKAKKIAPGVEALPSAIDDIPKECFYLIQKIQDHIGGTQADAVSVIKSLPDKTKLEEHLKMHLDQVATGYKPLSHIATFKTRVKQGWGMGKSAEKITKTKTHQSQEPITSILPDPKLEKFMDDVALATQRFNDLSKDDQQLAIDRFLEETSDYIRKAYKSDGMASQSIRGSFNAWLVESNYFE